MESYFTFAYDRSLTPMKTVNAVFSYSFFPTLTSQLHLPLKSHAKPYLQPLYSVSTRPVTTTIPWGIRGFFRMVGTSDRAQGPRSTPTVLKNQLGYNQHWSSWGNEVCSVRDQTLIIIQVRHVLYQLSLIINWAYQSGALHGFWMLIIHTLTVAYVNV